MTAIKVTEGLRAFPPPPPKGYLLRPPTCLPCFLVSKVLITTLIFSARVLIMPIDDGI